MKIHRKELTSMIVAALFIGTIVLPLQNFPSKASDPSTVGNDTQYWAFIVGVGQYADNPEQNRPDMILEANDFKDLLLQTPWWSEDHIRLLTAADATRSNIIEGFHWLQKVAGKDDVVVVYLSSHGNYLPFDIPPFDEADKKDEILATYWGFAYNNTFINDDTINILLNRMKSNNVCLIVDSCYAGGFNDHWKLLKIAPEQHRVIIMGSCEDELSYSGGFAPYLIDGFRGYADVNGDGQVTAEEAFAYAQPRAIPRQTPTIYDGYPGDLVITADVVHHTSPSFSLYPENSTPDEPFIPSAASAETAVLCGYVTSYAVPIENAVVTVTGRIDHTQYYSNYTTSDSTGFYFIHVPPIRIRITATAYGYCDAAVGQIQVTENQTYWVNISLVPHPPETSIVCGYISSLQNETPLSANVSLRWQGDQNQTYRNRTTSGGNGFYQIWVAPGHVYLDFSKEGYFSESRYSLNTSDSSVLWINMSLYPFPPETSVVCGYVTNSTGAPLSGLRIAVNWVNISIGHEYSRNAETDTSGFFSIPIAPGELYIDFHEMEERYYDPYRHDAVAGKPLWMNITFQDSISVQIAKPLRAFYINNHRLFPWDTARIVGPIDIEATNAGFSYGPGDWQVQKVEFYIDGALVSTVSSEPYIWTWSTRTTGKHTIKVIAYGLNSTTASAEIEVVKFL